MPKKKGKKEEEGGRVLLGRPSNAVSIGVVGLPNVGKSLLFNILSGQQVSSENYPFCTIDPSKAQVAVPDDRWEFLCEQYKPKKRFGAILTCWDIAGLVRGAHEGNGLGNEFLSNIGACDAIYHVVRAFSDKKIEHVDGDVDPIRDLATISDELRLKDIALVKKHLEKIEKLAARSNDKKLKAEVELSQRVAALLEDGGQVRLGSWSNADVPLINKLNLFTAKPVVYLVNVSKKGWCGKGSKWIKPIKKWVKANDKGAKVIPFSARFEEEYSNLETDEEKRKFLEENETRTHIPKIIWAGYKALNLIHYFTCGEDEVKCWTIRKGTLAPQAAGVIHTDFEKGFICAETMSYEDYVKFGSEAECKKNGAYKQNGKNYTVGDGDILYFKFNV